MSEDKLYATINQINKDCVLLEFPGSDLVYVPISYFEDIPGIKEGDVLFVDFGKCEIEKEKREKRIKDLQDKLSS